MTTSQPRLAFVGRGSQLFPIILVNALLTIITFGLYYPWAKAKKLQFMYSQTTLADHPFTFTGTGIEMFKGFVRAFVLLIGIIATAGYLQYNQITNFGILLVYGALLCLFPFAIHGGYKYRMAKTLWKGIRFGYTGDITELLKIYFTGIFLSIITFGIYSPWFVINLRTYLIGNIKFGDAKFAYKGNGGELFGIIVGGYLLTIFTLGIYFPWWQKKLFAYYINNVSLSKGEKTIQLKSTVSVGSLFVLFITNFFLIAFTFGLAYAWVVVRSMKYVAEHIELEGDYSSLEELVQTQTDYDNATGDDMADLLDLGLIV